MTAEERIAQLEQENVQLRAEFCQISNLILAQKSEFWYADLIILTHSRAWKAWHC